MHQHGHGAIIVRSAYVGLLPNGCAVKQYLCTYNMCHISFLSEGCILSKAPEGVGRLPIAFATKLEEGTV